MLCGKNCCVHFLDEDSAALSECILRLFVMMWPTSGTGSIQTQAVTLQSLYSARLDPKAGAKWGCRKWN